MTEILEGPSEFMSFRALKQDASLAECNQLFGHLAQLFSFVSERCDDHQVAQYDHVLCQLADLVEVEARTQVAGILAKLDRAPGAVVYRLAGDEIAVAQPILEFSKVLSDDDLIEIVKKMSEQHRIAVAGRQNVGERVGDAIVEHGARPSLVKLVKNTSAQLSAYAVEKMVENAANDSVIAADLRGRSDIDWQKIQENLTAASRSVMSKLSLADQDVSARDVDRASSVVYSRMKNNVGFTAREWKLAWNQIKALNDRKNLDSSALSRFARFGYGHHVACGLTILLDVPEAVFVKWLATQDYIAMTVCLRALGVSSDVLKDVFPILPWRESVEEGDFQTVIRHFDTLLFEEAQGIFRLWRAHFSRKKVNASEEQVGAVA